MFLCWGEVDGDGAQLVKSIAGSEVPPRGRSRREVRENCQGWVVRVVETREVDGSGVGGGGEGGCFEGDDGSWRMLRCGVWCRGEIVIL